MIASFVLVCKTATAQLITSGTHMTVVNGTVISSNTDMNMSGGGTLDVQGTLILKKNLINMNSSATSLGTGLIEFSGTGAQSISGPNVIQDLRINNPSGVTLSNDTRVNGTMKLKNGKITLGSSNLVLGPSASDSGGSSSSMIVPAGTGELRKEFSAVGTFSFPIGDTTGTAEYSPVTITFNSGTFGIGNYTGIKVTDTKYNNDSISGNYLSRYWSLSQSGITGYNYNATFKYPPADVTGTESSVYCTKVNPSPVVTFNQANPVMHELTATGITTPGTFTGMMGSHDINLKAFLEGPFSVDTMTTVLNYSGLIPLTQPYSGSPWYYTGPESVPVIPVDVVDWVLIELRQANVPDSATATKIIKRRAAFIKRDGTIVDVDGISPVRFYNANILQNLYPVIRHRNHLAIMASAGVTKSGGVYSYDFTDSASKTFGAPSGIKLINTSWCMIGGNGSPDADINTDDISFSWNTQFGNYGYYSGDFSLNGSVDTDDISFFWNPNFGTSGGITDHKAARYHSMVP